MQLAHNSVQGLIDREKRGMLTDEDKLLIKEINATVEKARSNIFGLLNETGLKTWPKLPRLSAEEQEVLREILFTPEGLQDFQCQILQNVHQGRAVLKKSALEKLKNDVVAAQKQKDEADERLAEVMEKRVPLFSKILQLFNNDEALFFLRLFSCRFEKVTSTVFEREDVPEFMSATVYLRRGMAPADVVKKMQENEKKAILKPYRKKAKVGRWRLPYGAEIAREMQTSEANVSQRKKRLFEKFPAVQTYYDQTGTALNEAYESARKFEATKDSFDELQNIPDGQGGFTEHPKLMKQYVKAADCENRKSFEYHSARAIIDQCYRWINTNGRSGPRMSKENLIEGIRPIIIDLEKIS